MADLGRQLADLLYGSEPVEPQKPTYTPVELELLRRALGAGEAAATIGTGILGSVPAGLAGLASMIPTRGRVPDLNKAVQRIERVQDATTFMPRTQKGQEYLENVGSALSVLGMPAELIGEKTLQYTGSPGLATAANVLLDPANLIGMPGSGKAVMAAGRGAARGLDRALGTLPTSPLPGAPTGQQGAIKMKGGNWLAGEVESATEPLIKRGLTEEQVLEHEARPRPIRSARELMLSPEDIAANNWIEKKLNRYIKNEMATPEDPVRKLAEQGILHYQPETDSVRRINAANRRMGEGERFGRTPLARDWEDISDLSIYSNEAGYFRDPESFSGSLKQNPWLEKVSPETKVYELAYKGVDNLGFNHLIDELKNSIRPDSDLPAHLRWKPEDLEKVTMEQAVRRVHDINQYREAKRAEANEVLARNPATFAFKDYQTIPGTDKPNEKGLAWKEIKMPESVLPEGYTVRHLPEVDMWGIYDPKGGAEGMGATEREAMGLFRRDERKKSLQDALKYEADVMGNCVGGYCDRVLSGKSKIYSLRDSKGEPRVTIEVGKPDYLPRWESVVQYLDQAKDQVIKDRTARGLDVSNEKQIEDLTQLLASQMAKENAPLEIKQIKGSGKKDRSQRLRIKETGYKDEPDAYLLPFVQDFVRGGNWSKVADLQNTGLRDMERTPNLRDWLRSKGIETPRYVTEQEYGKYEGDFVLNRLGKKEGGSVRVSDNLDTMALELQVGGAVKRAAAEAAKKAASQASKVDAPVNILESIKQGTYKIPAEGLSKEDKVTLKPYYNQGLIRVEDRGGEKFIVPGKGAWFEFATPEQKLALDQFSQAQQLRDLSFMSPTESLLDSAQAHFYDFEIAPGVRSIPIKMFEPFIGGYDSKHEKKRIESLTKAIQQSKQIEPLFIGLDPTGLPYIMEGQHRIRALKALGHEEVPARIVVNMDDLEKAGGGAIRKSATESAKKAAKRAAEEAVMSSPSVQAQRGAVDLKSKTPYERSLKQGYEHGWLHGTTGDIRSFDPSRMGETTGATSAKKGFFFVRDPIAPPEEMLKKTTDPKSTELVKGHLQKLGVPDEEIEALNRVSFKGNAAETASGYSSIGGSRTYKEAMRNANEAEKRGDWTEYDRQMQIAEASEINRLREVQGLVAKYGDRRDEMTDAIQKAVYDKPLPQKEAEELDKWFKSYMPYGWYNLYGPEQFKVLKQELISKIGEGKVTPAIEAMNEFEKVRAERNLAEKSQEGANVMPIALRYKNPFVYDFKGSSYRDQSYSDLIDQAILNGHDALILRNTYDPGGGPARLVDIGVVFDPSQIRSTFAKFNPKDIKSTDITKKRGGKVSITDNLETMALELQEGGAVKKQAGGAIKAAAKAAERAAKAAKPEVLTPAEREANLAKFREASKVPQRLYHGTMATEDGKRQEAIRRLKPSKEGALGSGVYLTPQSEFASTYAGFPAQSQLERDIATGNNFAKESAMQLLDRMNRGAVESHEIGGNILPVYAQLKNPLVLEGKGDPMIEALVKLGMNENNAARMVERAYETKGYIGKQVENLARAAGYDGLMQYRNGELTEVVSYNPNAIKSAIGNRGTYDVTNPEMSKKKGGRVSITDNLDTMRLAVQKRK